MKEVNIAKEVNDYRKGTLELSKRRNIVKLENELNIVQKRKRERTITARDIVQSLVCLEKKLGLPQGYMKEVEKAEQKRIAAERRARSNELGYFGEVGKRYKNEKVDSVEEIGYYTTQFGITVIYRITLSSGYELTWKASSTPHELEDENMEVDTVTFTVKDHGEYKGHKQTLVTRCKFTAKEKKK